MKNNFVPFEIAKELKELGFNVDCFAHYDLDPCYGDDKNLVIWENDDITENNNGMLGFKSGDYIKAPTYQQAFEFFRTKQLYHEILIDCTTEPKFTFHIKEFVGNPRDLTEREWYWKEPIFAMYLYRTYQEAEIDCLEKLIEMAKEK
jgi:hypothetical protein